MTELVIDLRPPNNRRKCGSCSLCCTLMSVRSLGKPAGQRCQHQRFSSKGACCKVYDQLHEVAPECRVWSCRWILDDAGACGRPDRTHYVIDMMPDFIMAGEDDEPPKKVVVAQIWVDPKYPLAYKDPDLLAWLDDNRMVALIRYGPKDGFVLFPPSRMKTGEWTERRSESLGRSHTAVEIFEAMQGA